MSEEDTVIDGLRNDSPIGLGGRGSRALYPYDAGEVDDIKIGQMIVYAGNGVFLPQDVEVPSGGIIFSAPYRAESSIGAAPREGRLSYASAETTSPNTITMAKINSDGFDITNLVNALVNAGDSIYLQADDDAGTFQTWTIDSITENAATFDFGVTGNAEAATFGTNRFVGAIFTDLTP